jgi:hypothetical protein
LPYRAQESALPRTKDQTSGDRRGICIAALGLALAAGGHAWAKTGFLVSRAELVPVGANYVLNADVTYDFSAAAIQALENSVPLTLAVNCRIERDRAYWWDETIVDYRKTLQIRYHPLGKLFQMQFEDSDASQSFTSLHSLLQAMGTIRRVAVASAEQIEKGNRYRASLSLALDIEALPLPLRPIAYLSPGWYLSSPRYEWSFEKSD